MHKTPRPIDSMTAHRRLASDFRSVLTVIPAPLESLPPGMRIRVQLMRDDGFREPLAKPLTAMIVRNVVDEDGFVEHGVQVVQEEVRREPSKPIREPRTPTPRRYTRPRMHTRDLRRGGRRRR